MNKLISFVIIVLTFTVVATKKPKCTAADCAAVQCVQIDCIRNWVSRAFPELCRCCPACYELMGKIDV